MNVNDAFPSKWLKAEDLRGQRHMVIIDRMEIETMQDGKQKWVIFFRGRQKALMLNKTNAMEIANAYGPEMNNWLGREIELFPAVTVMGGQSKPCIRVRPIYPAAGSPEAMAVAAQFATPPVQPQPVGAPLPLPPVAGPGEQAAVRQATAAAATVNDLNDEIPW